MFDADAQLCIIEDVAPQFVAYGLDAGACRQDHEIVLREDINLQTVWRVPVGRTRP